MAKKFIFIFLLIVFLVNSKIFSQQNKNSGIKDLQSIFQKISEEIKYAEGLNKAQLTILSDKKIRIYKILHYLKKNKSLFLFNSVKNGKDLKILYDYDKLNIYIYDYVIKKVYKKSIYDFSLNVLKSDFTVFDIINRPLIEDYRVDEEYSIENDNIMKFKIFPIKENNYSFIEIYVDENSNYQVKRFDYYDKSKVLMKRLEFDYGKFSIKEKDDTSLKEYPIKWKVTNVTLNHISILEFFNNTKDIPIKKELFDIKYIQN
ncbi:MAG: outer membrane lipoprotein-sorting protein [Spirochaetia bacterium]|nr:outer membrane lipoprotein-sorting protein [Spirochaetia bacterium]